jgi:hypothetical protein
MSLSTKQRNNMEWTPKHLVMHLIACGLSYHASSMHDIGLSVKMIMHDFWGYMISLMAIPCIVFLSRWILTKNRLERVLYSIKLLADCHISHSIGTKLAYIDY